MKLIDPSLLAEYIEARDINNAQLGRRAGVSRQYIWKLLHNHRTSCQPPVASAIELALGLRPGTLFRDDARKPPPKRDEDVAA